MRPIFIRYAIAALLLIPFGADAQRKKYVPGSIDLVAGQQLLYRSHFGSTFSTLSDPSPDRPLRTVGIAMTSGFSNNRREHYAGYLDYVQVIPQPITFYDSVNARVTGFSFGMHIFGKDLLPRNLRNVNLILSAGFHAGHIRIYGNDAVRQKNPFFAPSLSLAPRFLFGKLALQLRCTYGFDISRKNWKKMSFREPPTTDVPNLSMTGLDLSIGVGYCF